MDNIIDRVLAQIINDVKDKDLTSLEELLILVKPNNTHYFEGYLREETQQLKTGEFKSLLESL